MPDQQPPDREWSQVQPVVPRPDPIRPSTDIEHLKVEVVKLRDYFEMRISSVDEKGVMRVEALAKELAIAMRANAIAIDKAEAATEKRLAGLNEFRQSLSDQTKNFATQNTVDGLIATIDAKLETIRSGYQAELRSIRETYDAKLDAQAKIIGGLAVGVAVIQAFIQFVPMG